MTILVRSGDASRFVRPAGESNPLRRGRPRVAGLSINKATLLMALVAGALATSAHADEVPTPLPLEWCLERARAENPSLAGAQASAEAAAHRVRPAAASS